MGILDRLKAWWEEEDDAAPPRAPNAGGALPVGRDEAPGILVGRDPATGGLLWYRGKGNVICVSPSRQGKLVSSIGGNVIFHPGSLLCLDPKGEIAHHFHKLRAEGMGQPVYFLNPGLSHGLPCHGFNPLRWLDRKSVSLMSDAAMIAQAIIPPIEGKDSHWSDEAANLLRGLLLYAAFDSNVPDNRRDLITVRRLVQQGVETIKTTLLDSDVPEAETIGKMIEGKSENELRSVISTFTSNTNFLDDAGIQKVLGAHDFDLRELKSGRITVFLIVPLDMLDAWQKWYRLMVKLAIKAMMRQTKTPDVQALFIIDETRAVGHLEDIETAFGLMPGQGLRLFLVVQSTQQLAELYPRSYRDLFSNAGLVQAFSITDAKEATFFQEMMAQRPRLGGQMGQFEPGERVDQIMYRRPGMLLARIQGQAARWVERANWVNAEIDLGGNRIPLPIAPEIERSPLYGLVDTSKV